MKNLIWGLCLLMSSGLSAQTPPQHETHHPEHHQQRAHNPEMRKALQEHFKTRVLPVLQAKNAELEAGLSASE